MAEPSVYWRQQKSSGRHSFLAIERPMHPRQSPSCRWDRRRLVFALLTAVLPACVARAQNAGMVEFVRDLYVRKIELHFTRAPVSAAAFLRCLPAICER
jgi:hypothetical protein